MEMKGMRLKKRDLEFLKFCGEQKFLFKSQVEEWFGVMGGGMNKKSAERVARRQLVRLKGQGLMSDQVANLNPAKIWKLTQYGMSLLKDRGLMAESMVNGSIDSQTVNHDQWVTQVRLAALGRCLAWQWMPEVILRLSSADKIPDAEVTFLSSKKGTVRIAIEIELTLKSESRLKTIFTAYDAGEYAMVLYFVSTPQLLETLVKIATQHCGKVYFCLVSDFCDVSRDMVWRNAHDSFNNNQFNGGQYVV